MKAAYVVTVVAVIGAGFVSTASPAGAKFPRLALTERQNELARTTALRRGDLPTAYRGGFVRALPTGFSCTGFSPPVDDLTATGYAKSRFSNGRGSSVSSAVTIFAGAPQVDLDMHRTIRPPLARCLGAIVATADRARLVSAARISFRSNLDHAAGYRIGVRSGNVDRTVLYYLFGHGRIECRLILAADGRTVPAGVRKLAVSLIESRMED